MSLPADSAGNNGHASKLRRFWAIGVVAVATTIVVARQPFDNGPTIRSDGYGYHAWTYALLRGDLNFKELNNETYAFHETRPGYWSNAYPPGAALVRMPIMVWLVGRGDDFGRPTPAEHVAAAILSAIALIATSALLFYASRSAGATDLSANVAVLAVVFGTGLFHYATYDAGYSHCWTALGMSALVALGARSLNRDGRMSAVAIVLLAAWLVLVRNTNVFALAILGGSYFVFGPRFLTLPRRAAIHNTACLTAGIAVGIAIQLALNSYAHGRFTVSSYEGQLFVWDRPMQWSVLTSVSEHGLFPYYPVCMLLVLVPFVVRRLWPAALVFTAIVAMYVILYGFWNMWNLGASFGHRGFVDVLPLGAPLFAVALTRIPKWPRRAIVFATLLSIYATVSLMAGYWRRTVPYHEISPETYWSHVVGDKQIALALWRWD